MAKKFRVPKINDRISVTGQDGVFAVTGVNPMAKQVNAQRLDGDTVMSHVPWADLHYLDEEDANQAAARIVRETTERD